MDKDLVALVLYKFNSSCTREALREIDCSCLCLPGIGYADARLVITSNGTAVFQLDLFTRINNKFVLMYKVDDGHFSLTGSNSLVGPINKIKRVELRDLLLDVWDV